MKLTEDQARSVHRWAAEGADLNGIQKLLQEEFGIRLTYMDTRFLVMDLGVEFPVKEETRAPGAGDVIMTSAPEAAKAQPGGTRVEVDEVVSPHYLISGKVTFQSGKSGRWYIDQTGRLGLDAGGEQPEEADIVDFQKTLQRVLREQGY